MIGEWGWLAPVMFAALFLLLLTGYPVAFVLGAVAMIFGVLGKAGARKSELLESDTTRTWPSGNLRQQRTYCCPSSRACFRLEGGQGMHIHVAESSFLNDPHIFIFLLPSTIISIHL